MSNSPLPFGLIKLEPFEIGVEKALDLEVGGRRVIYGQSVRPRIEIQAGKLEINLDQHAGDVVAALRLSDGTAEQTRFITVGRDQKIIVWSVHGQVLRQLSGHKKSIKSVWALSGGRLASWAEDKELIVWDTIARIRSVRIRTRARSAEDILGISSENCFCITERWWKTRIVSTQPETLGKTLAVLKGQSDPVTGARKLGSGAWITVAKSGTKLWNAQGILLSALPQFSLDDGYWELPSALPQSGCTVIVDDQHQVHMFAASGAR